MSEPNRVHITLQADVNVELWCSACKCPLQFYHEHVDETEHDGQVRDVLWVLPCSTCINHHIADLVEAGEIKRIK